jgi:hypothetical protein
MLLVRHADAGDRSTWEGPDHLRPLSPSGHLQAEGLVFRLEDYPVERILCSPTLRCQQTVQPLARDRLLRIEDVPALGVDASPAQLLTPVLGSGASQLGAVHPRRRHRRLLLTRLIANKLVVEDPLDWPKGSTWLLERTHRQQVRGRFLAPLVINAARTP